MSPGPYGAIHEYQERRRACGTGQHCPSEVCLPFFPARTSSGVASLPVRGIFRVARNGSNLRVPGVTRLAKGLVMRPGSESYSSVTGDSVNDGRAVRDVIPTDRDVS